MRRVTRPSDNGFRMRRESEFFGEDKLQLVYVASRLAEARALEELLGERGLDYTVEPDTYVGGFIFRRERVGAFFYVREADLDRTRAAMESGGYTLFKP